MRGDRCLMMIGGLIMGRTLLRYRRWENRSIVKGIKRCKGIELERKEMDRIKLKRARIVDSCLNHLVSLTYS